MLIYPHYLEIKHMTLQHTIKIGTKHWNVLSDIHSNESYNTFFCGVHISKSQLAPDLM
jgi:hypothetical protein